MEGKNIKQILNDYFSESDTDSESDYETYDNESEIIITNIDDIDQNWAFLDIAKVSFNKNWPKLYEYSLSELKILENKLKKKELQDGGYYPLKKHIFNAFYLTELKNIKVVIVGQDPYHTTEFGKPVAHGLSFSANMKKTPKSLINIFKELKDEYPEFVIPDNSNLSAWAKEGVFMLNKCLTVTAGKPGSHRSIWDGFVAKTIELIEEVNPNCIFVLWGRKAQELDDDKRIGEKVIKLTSSHPSPFSTNIGFFGCGHFKEINKQLKLLGKDMINWNCLTGNTLDEIKKDNTKDKNKDKVINDDEIMKILIKEKVIGYGSDEEDFNEEEEIKPLIKK